MPSKVALAKCENYQRENLPQALAELLALLGGWERFVGMDGGFVGMPGFGASAPAPALYEHFHITPQAVVEAVRSRLD